MSDDEDWDAEFFVDNSEEKDIDEPLKPKVPVLIDKSKPKPKTVDTPFKTLEADVQKNEEIETWLTDFESESSQQQRLSKLFKRLAKQAQEQATILEKLEDQSRKTRDKINALDNQINNMTQEINYLHTPKKKEFALELRALPSLLSEPLFERILMVVFLIVTALCGALIFIINHRVPHK